MYKTKAYSAASATSPLAAISIGRRDPNARDVQIEILFCGICHSDLNAARNEWSSIMPTVYPIVPGNEIVGRVTKIGPAVTKYQPGDLVAVGCLVDSDGTCPHCQAGFEQFCPNLTLTFNSPDKHIGGVTYGGYSDSIVVDERFVLRVPSNLDLAGTAPLLCAGITTYSPMRHWGVTKGQKVGVVGLGGLGHMGVKFARSFGAHVVVFTTSPNKKEDARRLGADEVVVSRNADEMQKHAGSFDFILDCVSADHDINAYINLLRLDGNITLVGVPSKPLSVSAFGLIIGRRSLSGSNIGGIAETQEMLDFCGAHNITADVEVIPIQKVNEAYERLLKSEWCSREDRGGGRESRRLVDGRARHLELPPSQSGVQNSYTSGAYWMSRRLCAMPVLPKRGMTWPAGKTHCFADASGDKCRLMQSSSSSMQSGFIMLSVLEECDLGWIFKAGRERKVAAGEVVVQEGVQGEFVYLILDGLFAVLSASAGGREIARLGPGEIFGEMSFLDDRPTSATISALEDSSVLAIARADLEAELPRDSGLAARLYKALAVIIAGRLRKIAGTLSVWTTAGDQPPASPAVVKRWEQIADRTQQLKEAILSAEKGEAGTLDTAALTANLKDFSKFMTDSIGKTSPESFAVRDELGARIQREILPYFLKARCVQRLSKKPRGYACDYEALNMILENAPSGIDRIGPLLDSAFLELPSIRAIRQRKESVTAQIVSYARECSRPVQVAGIGGGAAEPFFDAIQALSAGNSLRGTIVDFDPQGLSAVSARGAAAGLDGHLRLLKTSIVYLASSHQEFDMPEQDIIYSLTVADFLDDRLLLRLLNDTYVKLRPGGEFLLSSFHPNNPDRTFLDFVVNWKVFHRSERELSAVFNRSRFHKCKLQFFYEPEGIIFLAVCRK